jgi:cob(I)alamin adenosyltransferase
MSDTTAEPPRHHDKPKVLRAAPSLVLVNTGNGKGKSTAAFGIVMRAVARDWKVTVVQFVKSGKWNTGEERTARTLGVGWFKMGEGFTWESDDLSRDEAAASAAWDHAAGIINAGEHTLVVLDEVTYPMRWGWISTDTVVATLRDRPAHVNVVLTGRDAPQAVIDVADTVTEMREIKHAYRSSIRAKKGIDY